MEIIHCKSKPLQRKAIKYSNDFKSDDIKDLIDMIGGDKLDYHTTQLLVYTDRQHWINIYPGDYIILDENDNLLKVIKEKDFINTYNLD